MTDVFCEENARLTFDRFESAFGEISSLFKMSALDALREAYAEPGRVYHKSQHVLLLLRLFDKFRHLAVDPLAVKAAIFYHDAIYHIPTDPQYPPAHDNEERSIQLMRYAARDSQHSALIKAERLIQATASHQPFNDPDSYLLLDIDQAILATSRRRFAQFEQQVREEYKVYPLPLYCTSRMAILRSFADRRKIFAVPELSALWEDKARANLTWALEELKNGKIPSLA